MSKQTIYLVYGFVSRRWPREYGIALPEHMPEWDVEKVFLDEEEAFDFVARGVDRQVRIMET